MSVEPRRVIEREKTALATHGAALRGSSLPPPTQAPKGTFVHGLLLPFSLIAATLRDRELRGPYLRVVLVRGIVLFVVAALAVAGGRVSSGDRKHDRGPSVVIHKPKAPAKAKPIRVDAPGLHVNIDESRDTVELSLFGEKVPVHTTEDGDAPDGVERRKADAPREPPVTVPATRLGRVMRAVTDGWAWLLAFFAILSATEAVIVFFSRRWDDWLSFHASRLAEIRPEEETPKTPKIAIDVRWLYRKLKRRMRGYVVFAAGLPALFPLRLVPTIGPWLFSIAATLWGWYWLGVFSASKSAHAWADEESALSPAPIRALEARVSRGRLVAPLRWYGRAWARITRGVNPAATTFERSPAAFLGLALARVVLSLPWLYFLARPIIPVAAGRLCAEADRAERFSLRPASPAIPPSGPSPDAPALHS